jgi:hypothetical protein
MRMVSPYCLFMEDPTKRPISEWLKDLEESEAQVDAGLTVALEPVLERLRESIRLLETKSPGENRRGASGGG